MGLRRGYVETADSIKGLRFKGVRKSRGGGSNSLRSERDLKTEHQRPKKRKEKEKVVRGSGLKRTETTDEHLVTNWSDFGLPGNLGLPIISSVVKVGARL